METAFWILIGLVLLMVTTVGTYYQKEGFCPHCRRPFTKECHGQRFCMKCKLHR